MATILCEVCRTEPKKYKCPTCAIPYCSLNCYKSHKTTHENESEKSSSTQLEPLRTEPAGSATTPALEQPLSHPINPPASNFSFQSTKKPDFSSLPTSSKYQTLLSTHPDLLLTLQRVYAATLEPERNNYTGPRISRGTPRGRYNTRSRGGRWRGGFNRRGGREDHAPRWTEKKGEEDAMKLLKSLREGNEGAGEQAAMKGFVDLVGEMFGPRDEIVEQVGEDERMEIG